MKKEKPGFLIAEDVLKDMFEGKEEGKSKEVMQMLKKIKDSGENLIIKTPMSHFLRALFLSDPNLPIKNIQKVLSFTQVMPSFANFKNKQECMDELIMIVKVISGYKK